MYPKINDHLFIKAASSDATESETEYRSRITEWEDESFLIEVPMQEGSGRLKRLHIGDELSVYFMSEGGIKNYFTRMCSVSRKMSSVWCVCASRRRMRFLKCKDEASCGSAQSWSLRPKPREEAGFWSIPKM